MKRERENEQSLAIGNLLKFLSRGTKLEAEALSSYSSSTERVFECKTCNKHFPSFQALGGHRASHKKPKLGDGNVETNQMSESQTKPKSHECSICGLEFAIGQALGGHMRRHRAAALNDHREHAQEDPMATNENSSMKRVWLDLNLTPLENNLEFLKLGKAAQPATLETEVFPDLKRSLTASDYNF